MIHQDFSLLDGGTAAETRLGSDLQKCCFSF